MNEIIKGMANASEAIQENFDEQGDKITAVEQNIDLLSQKVVAGRYSYIQPERQGYVEVFLPYPRGFNHVNSTIAVAPMTVHGASLILYQATPYGDSMRLRFKTIDIANFEAGTEITFMYQFVRIDSGD